MKRRFNRTNEENKTDYATLNPKTLKCVFCYASGLAGFYEMIKHYNSLASGLNDLKQMGFKEYSLKECVGK